MQESKQNLKKKRGRPKKETLQSSEVSSKLLPLYNHLIPSQGKRKKPSKALHNQKKVFIYFIRR